MKRKSGETRRCSSDLGAQDKQFTGSNDIFTKTNSIRDIGFSNGVNHPSPPFVGFVILPTYEASA
jgi:hypothetical protein